MDYIKQNHLAILIIIWLVFAAFFLGGKDGNVGASYDPTTFENPITFSDDATISGGNLNVTTGASATSTIVVGAIETYATSSAQKICIKPAVTGATSTFAGTLYFSYGECTSL